MPLPKFSSRYPDVKQVFDFALREKGARYTLDSPGQATHWRSRAYAFRKALWSELNLGSPVPPVATPYDGIRITLDESTCVIHVGETVPTGILTRLDGGDTAPTSVQAPVDELEAEAEDLRKRLGIDL
jgi:hypothetical protein